MRICKVWDSEYPWDVRVEKICRSLLQAGHQVHLVCRNRRGDPVYEARDGLIIHRLRTFPGWLASGLTFPAFCNPLWLAAVGRVVREQACDVILVRDLPLALAGAIVGKWTGRPVVMDFAENYPAMLRDFWPVNRRHLINWIIRNPWIAKHIERLAIRCADRILVVVEEAKDRLLRLGVEKERLSIVMNTPWPERFLADEKAIQAETANRWFDIIYLGFLDCARGVDIAIQAMPYVLSRIPNARLVILGNGNHEGYLQGLASELRVADHVLFQGWVPYETAYDWIAASSVGIVPHDATESWSTTIPNKLFDYMALGKPVLVSDAEPVRRIVEAESCGLAFRNRDIQDFACRLVQLADPALRRSLGSMGRRAVAQRYNWERESAVLLEALNTVRMGSNRSTEACTVPARKS